ncbi:MAG: shikimate dehydrogenase [Dehalococcoidia bacterium]|nr:shikimate dehydrogenase [Dehalococcoidia bacterium]
MNDWTISGKTSVCGVIGDPIEHTMSPAMHNAAFRQLELDYIYVAFRVTPAQLGKAIAGMKALNIRGLNVTIPHKVNVIPFLDRLDPLAEKIGAVNTIVNEDGALTGYNTDASGFLQALKEGGGERGEPKGKKILLLGAGGAARAIAFIIAAEGGYLTILNRKEELPWAEDIARNIGTAYHMPVGVGELTREKIERVIPDTDILVNATSVGMTPGANESPFPADLLCASLLVFDIVYNPLETRLLREAKTAGARTISGLEMLIWQGVLAFEKWTGQHAPVDLMRQTAQKILKKG